MGDQNRDVDDEPTGINDSSSGVDPSGVLGTAAAAVTSPYKVLGQFEAPRGTAVLGQNDATSGAPVGVEGAVPNASGGYGLSTPDDARIQGRVVSTSTHEIWVAGRMQLGLGPAGNDYRGNTAVGNVIGGFNDAHESVGSTIGGGGRIFNGNEVYDDYGTIGGGEGNQAGQANASGTGNGVHATVCGGWGNTASGEQSTVGGGYQNTVDNLGEKATLSGGASNYVSALYATVGGGTRNHAEGRRATVAGGEDNYAFGFESAIGGGSGNQTGTSGSSVNHYGTVPGGQDNLAEGWSSFAAGQNAEAVDDGAFVWADRSGVRFGSDQSGTGSSPTGDDTFHVRATGGVRFVTGLNSSDDPDAGQYLSSGGNSWLTVSAKRVKHDVRPVDPQSVLESVESLTVSRWAYDARPGVDRMGPMAGEFYEAFELGDDSETIGHVDADGVALAAIQGLAERLDRENERLRDELAEKDDRIDDLETRLAALERRVDGGQSAAAADD